MSLESNGNLWLDTNSSPLKSRLARFDYHWCIFRLMYCQASSAIHIRHSFGLLGLYLYLALLYYFFFCFSSSLYLIWIVGTHIISKMQLNLSCFYTILVLLEWFRLVWYHHFQVSHSPHRRLHKQFLQCFLQKYNGSVTVCCDKSISAYSRWIGFPTALKVPESNLWS
jgi:hypothetical protein